MKLLLILLMSINLCYGQKITVIKKGELASYDGYLIDSEQEKVFRTINEKKKLLESKNLVLSDLRLNSKQLEDFQRKRAETAERELQKEQFKSSFRSTLAFIGGVLVTGLISYGTMKTLRK